MNFIMELLRERAQSPREQVAFLISFCLYFVAAGVPFGVFGYAVEWYIVSMVLAAFLGLLTFRLWVIKFRNGS